MANEEHLAILKQGVKAWNQWRQAHREILPDLSDTDLSGANLSGAYLFRVGLGGANLNRTNLSKANLTRAELSRADLSRANLSGAELGWAELNGAELNGADLSGAELGYTIFADVDLSQIKGLDTVKYFGPSTIGIDTIYRSRGEISEGFLRGCGVPNGLIEYMRSLVGKPIEYYSCFISYSSQDDEFTHRLYNDLQGAGVRCWFAPEDLKIGDKFWERIDESIRIYDKLLVVLSSASVESAWVEDEVMRALEKERQLAGRLVLFPVRLDSTVLSTARPWATNLRLARHIGDFTHWKDHDAYQRSFTRLLRDLKAEQAPSE
jgi:uncharacterized protein YjbI with pentapeptide repeats